MATARDVIDKVRHYVNAIFRLDVVRVSGQYTLKAHIATMLDRYGVEAVLDVGANEGAFGDMMRKLGFQGSIYSFEPVAGAFEVLARRAAADPRWHVFNFALGSTPGMARINVSRFSQFSSILPATSYGNSWENMKVEHQQDIEIKTLDDLFEQGVLGKETRYFLKMDTQGYDVEVFKGAAASLSKVSSLLSELSLIPLYSGMPTYVESLETYRKAGFMVSGFYPITRHESLALNEVDCMLVRPGSALGLSSVAMPPD